MLPLSQPATATCRACSVIRCEGEGAGRHGAAASERGPCSRVTTEHWVSEAATGAGGASAREGGHLEPGRRCALSTGDKVLGQAGLHVQAQHERSPAPCAPSRLRRRARPQRSDGTCGSMAAAPQGRRWSRARACVMPVPTAARPILKVGAPLLPPPRCGPFSCMHSQQHEGSGGGCWAGLVLWGPRGQGWRL